MYLCAPPPILLVENIQFFVSQVFLHNASEDTDDKQVMILYEKQGELNEVRV